MNILLPENRSFDTAKIPEEGSEIYYCVLDYSNLDDVDYHFLNPKVINMTLDELDMTQSDVNTMMMNFVYDSVFINSPRSLTPIPNEIIEQASLVSNGTQRINYIAEKREAAVEKKQLTVNDIIGKIRDIERTVNRIGRIDTIPDVGTLLSTFVGPLKVPNRVSSIKLPKPDVDLPNILDTLGI